MWEAIVVYCAIFVTPGQSCPAQAAVIDLDGPYVSQRECEDRVRAMRWALDQPKLTHPSRECVFMFHIGTTRETLERRGIDHIRYCSRKPGNPCGRTDQVPVKADRIKIK